MSGPTDKVAIVTGGLRGLGRMMALGLAETGCRVLAVGHIEDDVASMRAQTASHPSAAPLLLQCADLRRPENCDAVVDAAREAFGRVDILVNNAGLTFTTIWPDRGRRITPAKFWEASDAVVQAVMDTNYVAADQMARRVAPLMVAQGWGRIINVTTKLDTMNRPGSSAYGASKAALEMASQVYAQELAGTGVTLNILNPGAGANTEGMAPELRQASRDGRIAPLVEPEQMVPPLLWLVSAAADDVNGWRFDANAWDCRLPPCAAAARAGRPAGFVLRPVEDAPSPFAPAAASPAGH